MRTLYKAASRIIISFFSILLLFPHDVYADNGNEIVHITETGVCYHAEGCSHLRYSDYLVTLHYAVIEHGFNTCDECVDRVPVYDGPEPLHPKMDKRDHYPGDDGNRVKVTSTPTPSPTPAPEGEDKNSDLTAKIALGIFAAFFGIPLLSVITDGVRDAKTRIHEKKIKQEEYIRDREKYYNLYGNKHSYELVDIPQGSFIQGGYPCTNNKKKGEYGDYTVYVGKRSMSVLHLNPNCGGSDLIPVNYYTARNLRHCKRCAMGKIDLPRIDWYMKYLEIEKIKNKYDIP